MSEPSRLDTDLEHVRETWTRLGEIDPLWAILSVPGTEDGKWDVATFFRLGEQHLQEGLAAVGQAGLDVRRGTALDFGCGVGRVTQAMSRTFAAAHGVDIAESMIRLAEQYNAAPGRCTYHVNQRPDLALFADDVFDFVYSMIVLQHMPPARAKDYLREFLRVVKPGGAVVFQLPAERAPAPLAPGQTMGTAPLPDEAFRAEVAVRGWPVGTRRLAAGGTKTVRVRVRNRSPVAWPSVCAPDGRFGVRVANQWLRDDGTVERQDDGRANLPTDASPGATVTVSLTVTAPDVPGHYVLAVDLAQEGVAWFSQKGAVPARIPVTVVTGRAARNEREREDDNPAAPATKPAFEMHGVPRAEVEELIAANGGRVAAVFDNEWAGDGWVGYLYVVTKPAK